MVPSPLFSGPLSTGAEFIAHLLSVAGEAERCVILFPGATV